jgi:PAS domain S-box-containing protein
MVSPGDDRVRVLFERLPVAAVIASLDGTLIAVNPAACRLWGRGEDELVGSSAADMVQQLRSHALVRSQAPKSVTGASRREAASEALRLSRAFRACE